MFRSLLVLAISFVLPVSLAGQIRPAEGARLNYRVVGFSFPEVRHAHNYDLQVANGWYNDEDSFRKNAIVMVSSSANKIIAEVPAFGREYTWRITSYKGHSKVIRGELHHFATSMSKWVNPDSVRLRILQRATAHQDDYVFLDGNKVLYDMAGNPVWFMPKIEKSDVVERPRDIKITPFGTVTCLIVDRIYEINYDGQVLWKARGEGRVKKSADSVVNLHHHEFTRLSNGNYMVFAFEHAFWPLSFIPDTGMVNKLKDRIILDSGKYKENILFGILSEYDPEGNIVWQWHSSDYFRNSDLFLRKLPVGLFDAEDTHANAFYFDEKKKVIYISFRNLNRIVKVEYPSGKVLSTFGKRFVPGLEHTNLVNGLFCGQHCVRESQDGYIYVFNNNICHPQSNPSIILMKESSLKKDSLEKVWEFVCPMDELTPKERAGIVFNTGGSVYEMADKCFFCCMGSNYGKSFLVNRDKKILWSAQPEMWEKRDSTWGKVNEYRGSIITRKQLESFIWGEPIDN